MHFKFNLTNNKESDEGNRFSKIVNEVELKITQISDFGITELDIIFIEYNSAKYIFYRPRPTIFFIWDEFTKKLPEEIKVTLAHETAHHILEQPDILEVFYNYISIKYPKNSVEVVLKQDYLHENYGKHLKKDEIVADFIASKIWGFEIVSSIPNYQDRKDKVDVLDRELTNGTLDCALQASTLV